MESREEISGILAEAPSSYNVENSTGGLSEKKKKKKKRGRPRKYGPDGSARMVLSPKPISSSSANLYVEKLKKCGTEKSGEWISCSTGGSFLPHIITVDIGEDVSSKIMSFCLQGPRAICIISAFGLISNVTLRQPNSSGNTLTYEGRFEILSLSGSFTPFDSRSGILSTSLASPDGRVLGGLIAGVMIAASPVQVIVGSFLPSGHHELKPKKLKGESTLNSSIGETNNFNIAPAQTTENPSKSAADINISLHG